MWLLSFQICILAASFPLARLRSTFREVILPLWRQRQGGEVRQEGSEGQVPAAHHGGAWSPLPGRGGEVRPAALAGASAGRQGEAGPGQASRVAADPVGRRAGGRAGDRLIAAYGCLFKPLPLAGSARFRAPLCQHTLSLSLKQEVHC